MASGLVFLLLALFLIWLALTHLFEKQVAADRARELQAIADTLAASLQAKDGKLILTSQPRDPRFAIPAGGRYWQVEGLAAGTQRSRSLWDTELTVAKDHVADTSLGILPGPSGDNVLVLVQDVQIESGAINLTATIRTAAEKSEYDGALHEFNEDLLVMLALTGSILALASGLQIFVGLRPLAHVRREVSALRRGETNSIDMKGPLEVRPLISEINTLMLDGRAAVERARARASDLAHGLKTPLTILGQIGENLSRKGNSEYGQQIAEQVFTIRSRVDRQLALARAGLNSAEVGIDVASALQRLLKVAGPMAENGNVTIEVRAHSGLKLRADMTDFLEATGNILDNAIRHASRAILITAAQNGRTISIAIDDDGRGIGKVDQARVLERGIRLDETDEGSGLGLAISADILRAYGGSLSLQDSNMGGLSVQMEWPSVKSEQVV